jgi:hypothetical protein
MSKTRAKPAGRSKPDLVFSPWRSRCRSRAIARRGGAGGASRDRTDDLKLAKLALSQLSYGPKPNGPNVRDDHGTSAEWWAEEELNLRPHAYQACALTT